MRASRTSGSPPQRRGHACRPTCRPASTWRRSRPARSRSRASARPSPRSSASPSGARPTRRRSSRTGPSSRQTFGDFIEGSYLAHAVYGYFLNGGGAAYVVRIGADGADADRAPAELTHAEGRKAPRLPRVARSRPARPATTSPSRSPTPDEPAEDTFKLIVNAGRPGRSRSFDNVTTKQGQEQRRHRGQGAVEADHVEEIGSAGAVERVPATRQRQPRRRRQRRAGPGDARRLRRQLRRPHRLRRPRGRRRGHDARGARPDGRLPAGHHRPRGRQGRAAGDDRPLRADGRPGRHPRRAAGPQRPAGQGLAGRQGRLRLEVRRRSTGRGSRSSTRSRARRSFVPPCGHVAGIWARNDDTRGVHKAPANEVVRGAISLELNITKGEHDQLNPIGINCIRAFPGPRHPGLGRPHAVERPGVALPQRAPAVQLRRGVDPRGHPVGRLRAERLRALGAGQADDQRVPAAASGATARCSARRPAEAFFVKCDAENNPPENRDAGQLIVEIGIAPGEAGRVRRLPHRPVLRRRGRRASRPDQPSRTTTDRLVEGSSECRQPIPCCKERTARDRRRRGRRQVHRGLGYLERGRDRRQPVRQRAGQDRHRASCPGKPKPPTITLKRGLTRRDGAVGLAPGGDAGEARTAATARSSS